MAPTDHGVASTDNGVAPTDHEVAPTHHGGARPKSNKVCFQGTRQKCNKNRIRVPRHRSSSYCSSSDEDKAEVAARGGDLKVRSEEQYHHLETENSIRVLTWADSPTAGWYHIL